ncbi:MAG: hypothetical protein L0228_20555 [Planctomycetes bacterium]|nr:hypothetical protein [Planctomycetota bacterium]
MNFFDPQAYGPVFAPLLATDRRRPLDAGMPGSGARAALESLSTKTAFAHAKIVDRDMAGCCISGVWLLHDFLDESHAISQSIETPSGSFWHAIMHRREGDFSNAKYWLRRVGRHPVLDAIGDHVAASAAADADSSLRHGESAIGETRPLESGHWDPFAFVDLCEAAVEDNRGNRELCLDIQQAECELLFDHCYRAAVGA